MVQISRRVNQQQSAKALGALGVNSTRDLQELLVSMILSETVYDRIDGGPEKVVNATNEIKKIFPSELMDLISIQCCDDGAHHSFLVGEGNGTLFVAFTGTKQGRDVLTDVNLLQQSWSELTEQSPPILVHRGFQIRAQNIPIFHLHGLAQRKRKRLVLCGHSLGGAIAIMAALKLLVKIPPELCAKSQISCITFAAPAVGNIELSNLVNNRGWSDNFRNYVLPEDNMMKYLNLIQIQRTVPLLKRSTSEGSQMNNNNQNQINQLPLFKQIQQLNGGREWYSHFGHWLYLQPQGAVEENRFQNALQKLKEELLSWDQLPRKNLGHFSGHRMFAYRYRITQILFSIYSPAKRRGSFTGAAAAPDVILNDSIVPQIKSICASAYVPLKPHEEIAPPPSYWTVGGYVVNGGQPTSPASLLRTMTRSVTTESLFVEIWGKGFEYCHSAVIVIGNRQLPANILHCTHNVPDTCTLPDTSTDSDILPALPRTHAHNQKLHCYKSPDKLRQSLIASKPENCDRMLLEVQYSPDLANGKLDEIRLLLRSDFQVLNFQVVLVRPRICILLQNQQQINFLAQKFIQLGGQYLGGEENACPSIILQGIRYNLHFIGNFNNINNKEQLKEQQILLQNFLSQTQAQFERYKSGYDIVLIVSQQQQNSVPKQKLVQLMKEFQQLNGNYQIQLMELIFGKIIDQPPVLLSKINSNFGENLIKKLEDVNELCAFINQNLISQTELRIRSKL